MLKLTVAGIGEQHRITGEFSKYRAIIQDVNEDGYKDTEKEHIIVGEPGESFESVEKKGKAYIASQTKAPKTPKE